MLDDELMHPSDYLSAPEFKGRDVTLTIESVGKSDLFLKGGKKKKKPVFTFKETPKKFVCNATCADSIAQMYGTQAREWIGKRITLYPTKTTFGKDTVDCVRVREKVPGEAAKPKQDEPPEQGGSQDGDDFVASLGEGADKIGD